MALGHLPALTVAIHCLCSQRGSLHPCRMPSQLDVNYMQRLMRDMIPDAFEKFYLESSVRGWNSLVQDDILYAAFTLMDLVTAELKVCSMLSQCTC